MFFVHILNCKHAFDVRTIQFTADEVPLKLKVLVRVIARAFYQPQQIVVLDILAKYPWSP